MKFLLALILLLPLCKINACAQGNLPINWVQFTVPGSGLNYKLPYQTFRKDTARVYFNSCNVDSLLGFTVVVVDSLQSSEQPDSLFLVALQAENGDTLRALVAGIILLEQAILVELDTGHIGNTKYLDAGFELPGGDSLHIPLLFVRYILRSDKLHTFSISGWSHDLNRLLAVKETYYESINL